MIEFIKKHRVILISLVSAAVILALTMQLLYHYRVIPHKMYDGARFGIEQYRSASDRDGDGIDDQTDILLGVRAYIATSPMYKSVYYGDTGWPDDGYGVCTDVVARGLLAAGYDLMELMATDISLHPERYGSDVGDKLIDFRRVRNQLPYFKANAVNLTTDVRDIEEWQGGDIVVWDGHVGIISDKRNHKGIPFVIHHGSPDQKEYEEDILGTYGKVLGHFRIS